MFRSFRVRASELHPDTPELAHLARRRPAKLTLGATGSRDPSSPLSCASGISRQNPSDQNQHDARGEKQQVEQHLLRVTGKNMVNAKDLMIDEAFDDVEETPAREHSADERFTIPEAISSVARFEKHADSQSSQDPRCEVEEAVLRVLQFKRRHRLHLTRLGRANEIG